MEVYPQVAKYRAISDINIDLATGERKSKLVNEPTVEFEYGEIPIRNRELSARNIDVSTNEQGEATVTPIDTRQHDLDELNLSGEAEDGDASISTVSEAADEGQAENLSAVTGAGESEQVADEARASTVFGGAARVQDNSDTFEEAVGEEDEDLMPQGNGTQSPQDNKPGPLASLGNALSGIGDERGNPQAAPPPSQDGLDDDEISQALAEYRQNQALRKERNRSQADREKAEGYQGLEPPTYRGNRGRGGHEFRFLRGKN